MAAAKELPILSFASAALFERWLAAHHQLAGVWIKMAKKASGIASVTHDEALDVALCFGWIDGQRNGHDDSYFLQKFTPRRPKSLWSKRNTAKITKLTAAGRMRPSGLAEVAAAKRDGRWKAAYAGSKEMVFPKDFRKAVEKDKKARMFLSTLSKTNLYAIAWRLETAKTPETRQRRFAALLAMVGKGEKFH